MSRSYDECLEHLAALGIRLPHVPEEFRWMWHKVAEMAPRSLVEIGSRHGGSLFMLALLLPRGGTVVAVDLPWMGKGPKLWGQAGSWRNLERVAMTLRKSGLTVKLVAGNSREEKVVRAVRRVLPVADFCFIDGDHSCQGVRSDWKNYGRRAAVVGFHDTNSETHSNGPMGCKRLWEELLAEGAFSEHWHMAGPLGTSLGRVAWEHRRPLRLRSKSEAA